MQQAVATNDLTTTRAPFIEQSKDRGDMFIRQPYELYSERNQEAWRRLYERMLPRWQQYANTHFLEGIEKLAIDPNQVPRLEDVNQFLAPLTGFVAKAVAGYIPAYLFFDSLRRREFPTTITIRDVDTLDYLPEPDIFHDISGHVPMHTDKDFAEALVAIGDVAQAAAEKYAGFKDREQAVRELDSVIKALARFFWFTVEFGLMRSQDGKGITVYGSGLLSSYGEIKHSVESPEVQRYPFQLEWVVNQYFEIHHYQPLLFVVDSFDHLYSEADRLRKWVLEGKVSNVSPGEPLVDPADLESFLNAV
ncbi:MAG: phenylalanine 4-monooxygenase [Acidobacteriota bacterium]|nr:phenylalanine 4-monooxygenase [Acidobacteriota bacterium]